MSTSFLSPLLVLVFLAVLLASSPSAGAAAGLPPVRLRCEYRENPLGIDCAQPRLEWIWQAAPKARGVSQTAYHLLVASSPALLAEDRGDLWDSGQVGSSRMSQIAYAGRPLGSGRQCWWKVRVLDQSHHRSAWSEPATWTMGVLHPKDWHGAKWIGSAATNSLLLRRGFSVKPHLVRAVASVCGLGQYEMTLNGSRVSDHVLTPGWTLYSKTCLYDTYEITSALHSGRNIIGLFLGNGFYNIHPGRYTKITGSFGPLRAICLLRLTYANGTEESIVTDENWKVHDGPITFSSIYGGEDYDGRLLPAGWDLPRFEAAHWDPPVVTDGPGGTLKGTTFGGPPIRAFGLLTPVRTRMLSPASAVYDLGQNASLLLRLKVTGPRGSSVKVTPSELVYPNGDIDDAMCGGDSYWHYTLSGTGTESYESKFYYRGGRYLKVELKAAPGSAVLPAVALIGGDVIHADAPVAGHFSCSSRVCNKIYRLIRWAQLRVCIKS